MSDHELFMQAILERPDDDAPRLMYSDWLTEHGDLRGEFIRVQCEIEKASGFDKPYSVDGDIVKLPRWQYLKARERELLESRDDFGTPFRDLWFNHQPSASLFGWEFTYRRGFVDEVHLTTEDFLQHAATLFRAQPITRVRLTDREPLLRSGEYCWYVNTFPTWHYLRHHCHHVPSWCDPSVASGNDNGMVKFDSISAAHAWLSDRCVEYGRKKAGLPVPELEVKRA